MLTTIKNFFQFQEQNTSFKIEVIAGITTFLTMAYVIVVNPAILATTGMDNGAIFMATCLAAAFGSLAMGLFANYPLGLAPSMGLTAYFAYVVVQKLGYPWQIALGAVFISGLLFVFLTLLGIRQKIIYLIPDSLKIGLSAGIGLFLGMIALKNISVISVLPNLQLHWQALFTHATALCLLGLIIIILLERFRVLGAILLGILAITLISILFGLTQFQGVVALPPSILPTLGQLHISLTWNKELFGVIFTFFFVALFDSTGTLIAVLYQAHLIPKDGKVARLTQALFADSTATIVGSLLGTSTTMSYIESSAGARAGGRTGFTAIVIGVLFLCALFFAPLTKTIPPYATAPALLYVAILMAKNLSRLKWRDFTESIPALIITLGVPLTFSIAKGISLGVVSYVLLQIITGKFAKLNFTLCVLAALLFIYLGLQW